MKRLCLPVALAALFCVCAPMFSGCSLRGYTLTVYNWGDFIDESVLDDFTAYYRQVDENFRGVDYRTCDTPETMYTKLAKSGEPWDVACNSDYLEGRMLRQGRLQPFPVEQMPNYSANVSDFSKRQYRVIQDSAMEGVDSVSDYDPAAVYGVGYMWGTMGIVYNVADVAAAGGEDALFADWNLMWNAAFNHRTYMKNSVRESFLVGLLQAYTTELSAALAEYRAGRLTAEGYNEVLRGVLNTVDETSVGRAQRALLDQQSAVSVKYDVDYDKIAMASGQASLGYCWAGDGFKAIRMGAQESPRVVLSYDVPDTGTNLFFDGWFLNAALDADTPLYRAAVAFVDYLCTPPVAQKNMNKIGYASSVAGLEMLEWGAANWTEGTTGETRYVWDDKLVARGNAVDVSYFFAAEDLEAYRRIHGTSPKLNPVQYPDRSEMYKFAVVRTYTDDENDALLEMWTQVKTGEFPVGLFVVFAALVVLLLVLAGIHLVRERARTASSRRRRLSRRTYPRLR